MSSNETVERVVKAVRDRGVLAELHAIKGITHYGVYREGFEEATKVELDWFDRDLETTLDTSSQPQN